MKCRHDHVFKKYIYCENKDSIFFHGGCIGYGCCSDFKCVPGNIKDEVKNNGENED